MVALHDITPDPEVEGTLPNSFNALGDVRIYGPVLSAPKAT